MPDFNSTLPLTKYEALGNDYLVLDQPALFEVAQGLTALLCDRHRGAGSDGLLLVDPQARRVRIINPDGSEAEKSGNGLRIAAAHLVLAHGAENEFKLDVPAGAVPVRVVARGKSAVTTEIGLGKPMVGPLERLDDLGVEGYTVDIGNPHFAVIGEPVTAERVQQLGPALERHPRFPWRTNVQLVEPVAGGIRIEVWERGAGYTLASGTSAAAASAVAMVAGLVEGDQVVVQMPGGRLEVRRAPDRGLYQTGPARRVYVAEVSPADLR